MRNIGARIASLREYLGLDPGQLAYKAGIDTSYVHRLERGERPNVSGEILARVADALHTSVDYLLGRTGDSAPPAGAAGPEPRIIEDAEALARVSPRVRRYALEMLDIFRELEEVAPDLLDQAVNILATQAELVKAAAETDRRHNSKKPDKEGEPQSTTTAAAV